MKTWKRFLPDLLSILLFAAISLAYFFPADIEGRILFRHDSAANRGLEREMGEHMERTGERTRWINSLFCGMPTYQTSPSYESDRPLGVAQKAYHLFLPENVWYVFAYLLGFYILLRAFDLRQWLAFLGAVAWAFSSYFFIIIAAGHIWKVMALAYLPPMIAGIVLAYRGRYLWGFILTAVFAAFEVNANHVQMTYYFLFVVLLMVAAFLVEAVRRRELARFLRASVTCLAAGLVGMALNASNLYHTWQYGQESMRGKSELVKADPANQTSSGLERDYITQWSYGIGETWTLLVPNAKGGASVPLSASETAMRHADPTYYEIYRQLGQYWGEQPGTSGPVYVGAFVLMLFVLGLFIVRGPMKWALLAATVLSILLSWGKNLMPFTDFFLDWVPLYSKFRTVASTLVMAEFTIPLLAMLALKEVVDDPGLLARKARFVYVSFALTAGFALLFAIAPSLFFHGFVSQGEMQALGQLPREHFASIVSNLTAMRKAVFTADCWRSFAVVLAGTILLLLYRAGRIRAVAMVGAMAVLCLVDMWQVNKRYLNDGMFVARSEREAPIRATEADLEILSDTTAFRSWRVLNLASNTFNENETSYHHNSIGGYHAAKLRRYQEVLDAYVNPEIRALVPAVAEAGGDMLLVDGDSVFPVLNMLDMRYVIFPVEDGIAIRNPYAFGRAWYVDRLEYVGGANEELGALGAIDLRHEAVADGRFRPQLGEAAAQDSASRVRLTSYDSDRLAFEASSSTGGVIVFSDVYYPGWTATVDGRPAELGRANYLLRALRVPPGAHEIALAFTPGSIRTTEAIAYAAYAILLISIIAAILLSFARRGAGTKHTAS